MIPLKVFLDHWAIVNLLEKPSFSAQKDRLVSFCKQGSCLLVLTIWYVHESLRDGDKERAKDLCSKINDLSREVPCLWIRLRTNLQEDEASELFFKSLGVDYRKGNPFCEEAIAIFPNHEKLPDINEARREGLLWFFENSRLFSKALKEQGNYPGTKSELKKAAETMVGMKDLLDEGKKQYVSQLLPSRTPSGLVIANESKRRFLQEMKIKDFRSIYFEALLSGATTKDAKTRPTEQDLLDLQHAVSAMPYTDVVILDAKFCQYALIVRKQWSNAQPLAECFDDIGAALDWIESKAARP